MTTIGFVGLGTMGAPMATNLVRAGYEVHGFDTDSERVEALVAEGGVGSHSLSELSYQAGVVITMLPDSAAVQEVVLGTDGLFDHLHQPATLIDMSTISPRVTRNIAVKLAEKGIAMLDAPVSGGEPGAKEGTLSITVGGPSDIFHQVIPILKVLGEAIVYMGEPGFGQAAKLVNNVIGTLNLLAVCEGLVLASKAGLDSRKLIEAVQGGAAASWMLAHLGPKMIDRDYRPGFKVRLNRKDLKLILEFAEETATPLPATALAHSLFNDLIAHDEGELGNQALVKSLERLGNTKVA